VLIHAAASGLPDMSRPFTVMGIETSCDDTGVAIVRSDGTILGEALASQYDIHKEWGGVVPGEPIPMPCQCVASWKCVLLG
jgi:hypothetical protein